MIRFLTALVGAVVLTFGVASAQAPAPTPPATPAPAPTAKKAPTAVITLEKGGEIRLEFYPEDAPKTVENFATLAKKGFYNGLNFHRVVPDFVVQGGCPKGNGTGGPGYQIKAEFNKRKHERGALGMARGDDPDSASSQFYITLKPSYFLDGQYTVFGRVTKGMEHVDKLKLGDRIKSIRIVTR